MANGKIHEFDTLRTEAERQAYATGWLAEIDKSNNETAADAAGHNALTAFRLNAAQSMQAAAKPMQQPQLTMQKPFTNNIIQRMFGSNRNPSQITPEIRQTAAYQPSQLRGVDFLESLDNDEDKNIWFNAYDQALMNNPDDDEAAINAGQQAVEKKYLDKAGDARYQILLDEASEDVNNVMQIMPFNRMEPADQRAVLDAWDADREHGVDAIYGALQKIGAEEKYGINEGGWATKARPFTFAQPEKEEETQKPSETYDDLVIKEDQMLKDMAEVWRNMQNAETDEEYARLESQHTAMQKEYDDLQQQIKDWKADRAGQKWDADLQRQIQEAKAAGDTARVAQLVSALDEARAQMAAGNTEQALNIAKNAGETLGIGVKEGVLNMSQNMGGALQYANEASPFLAWLMKAEMAKIPGMPSMTVEEIQAMTAENLSRGRKELQEIQNNTKLKAEEKKKAVADSVVNIAKSYWTEEGWETFGNEEQLRQITDYVMTDFVEATGIQVGQQLPTMLVSLFTGGAGEGLQVLTTPEFFMTFMGEFCGEITEAYDKGEEISTVDLLCKTASSLVNGYIEYGGSGEEGYRSGMVSLLQSIKGEIGEEIKQGAVTKLFENMADVIQGREVRHELYSSDISDEALINLEELWQTVTQTALTTAGMDILHAGTAGIVQKVARGQALTEYERNENGAVKQELEAADQHQDFETAANGEEIETAKDKTAPGKETPRDAEAAQAEEAQAKQTQAEDLEDDVLPDVEVNPALEEAAEKAMPELSPDRMTGAEQRIREQDDALIQNMALLMAQDPEAYNEEMRVIVSDEMARRGLEVPEEVVLPAEEAQEEQASAPAPVQHADSARRIFVAGDYISNKTDEQLIRYAREKKIGNAALQAVEDEMRERGLEVPAEQAEDTQAEPEQKEEPAAEDEQQTEKTDEEAVAQAEEELSEVTIPEIAAAMTAKMDGQETDPRFDNYSEKTLQQVILRRHKAVPTVTISDRVQTNQQAAGADRLAAEENAAAVTTDQQTERRTEQQAEAPVQDTPEAAVEQPSIEDAQENVAADQADRLTERRKEQQAEAPAQEAPQAAAEDNLTGDRQTERIPDAEQNPPVADQTAPETYQEQGNTSAFDEKADQEAAETARQAAAEQYHFKVGGTRGNGSADVGVHLIGDVRKISKKNLMDLQIIDRIAKWAHFSVEVVDGLDHNANGEYDGGRTLYLNINTENALSTVASHEMWHMVKNINADGAKRIQAIWEKWADRTGFDVTAAEQNMIRRYGRQGLTLTPEEAREELIANSFYTFMGDRQVMRQVYAENAGVFERVMNFVKRVQTSIREMLGEYEENTPEAQMLAEQDGALTELHQTMLDVLNEMRDLDGTKKAVSAVKANGEMTRRFETAVKEATNKKMITQAARELGGDVLRKTGNQAGQENFTRLMNAAQDVNDLGTLPGAAMRDNGLSYTQNDAEVNRALQKLGAYAAQLKAEKDVQEYVELVNGVSQEDGAKYLKDGRRQFYDVTDLKEDPLFGTSGQSTNVLAASDSGSSGDIISQNDPTVKQNLTDSAALQADLEQSNGEETAYGEHRSFSLRVRDQNELDFLENQKTEKTYKTMQLVDGKLYPPMAAVVAGNMEDHSELGAWEKATEHPELIKDGNKFTLNKGRGKGSLAAAYNPYMHSSNLMINDQFSGAWNRPELVTVECEVPVSENTSGYHAQYAKDSVGWHKWHTGTVAGQLHNKKGIERQVFLSRWIKPVRIVPDAEVAQHYKDLIEGTDIEIPDNVVSPSLRQALEEAGVPIKVTGKVKEQKFSLPGEKSHPQQAKFSISQLAEGLDFDVKTDVDGVPFIIVDKDGNQVKRITPQMVKKTPYGVMIDAALKANTINDAEAKAQAKMVADLATMAANYTDQAMVWEIAGNLMFSSIKNNSDKQYGTTVDYGTICTKTQAIIDVLSQTMLEKGRGLTREEILKAYDNTAKTGLAVPCPVCYVFSRWVGVPGLLGNMVEFQDRFTAMSEQQVKDWVSEMERKYAPSGEKTTADLINEFKAKQGGKIERIQKRLAEALKVKDKDEVTKLAREVDSLERELKDAVAYNWVTQVMCKRKGHTNLRDANGQVILDKDFTPVPREILLDMRRTGDFAGNPKYKKSWTFRNTRGAGMGKGILPYSGASLGDTIYHAAASSGNKMRNANKNALLKMDASGTLKAIQNAKKRQKPQNLIGGHRFQSTSDYRPEWGLDYMMTFMEMQAIGAKGQLYTKVIEAVDMFATAGCEVNLSIMGRGNGYSIVNGKPTLTVDDFSDITGISFTEALEKVKKYDNVQMILVGLNDTHIRLALDDDRITMVIPWHSSGSSERTLATLMSSVGEKLNNGTDYSATQNDTPVENPTKEQKDAARVRKNILTGKYLKGISDEDMRVIKGNKYLDAMYQKFYVDKSAKDTYHVVLSASQASQIFPHEYWDTTSTYDNADVNGQRFVEYCETLGLVPRFAQFKDDHGYWKLLIDRKMYNNDGSYHVPQTIKATNVKISDIAGKVSKVSYGDMTKIERAVSDTLDNIKAMEDSTQYPEDSLIDDEQEPATTEQKYSLPLKPKYDAAKAERYFGTTTNLGKSGYLTTNGKLLDMSGRHEGYDAGYRTVDHREIANAYEEEMADIQGTDALIEFMRDGNIRLSPESDGIDLMTMPNEKQIPVLKQFIRKAGGEVIVDISNEYGDTDQTFEYDSGTASQKIIDDLRGYFEYGIVPEEFDPKYSLNEDDARQRYEQQMENTGGQTQLMQKITVDLFNTIVARKQTQKQEQYGIWRQQVSELAQGILEDTNSQTLSAKEIEQRLTQIFEEYEGKKTDTAEDAENAANDALNEIRGLIEEALSDQVMDEHYLTNKDALRKGIYLNKDMQKELGSAAEVRDFRNAMSGFTRVYTNEAAANKAGALHLDGHGWDELQSVDPSLFNPETHWLERPQALRDFVEQYRDSTTMYDPMTRDFIRSKALEVMAGYYTGSAETDAGKRTKAALDKANKRVAQLNRQMEQSIQDQMTLAEAVKRAKKGLPVNEETGKKTELDKALSRTTDRALDYANKAGGPVSRPYNDTRMQALMVQMKAAREQSVKLGQELTAAKDEAEALRNQLEMADNRAAYLDNTIRILKQENKKNQEAAVRDDRRRNREKAKQRAEAVIARNNIKKTSMKLRRMMENPSNTAYIPKDYVRQLLDVVEAAQAADTRRIAQATEKWMRTVREMRTDNQNFYQANAFDQGFTEQMQEVCDILNEKNINRLEGEELQYVSNVLTQAAHQIDQAAKLIGRQRNEDAFLEGHNFTETINAQKGTATGGIRKAAHEIAMQHLSPEREFNKLAGYRTDNAVYRTGQELVEGQRAQKMMEMELSQCFEDLMTGKNAQIFRKFSGKNAELIDTGIQGSRHGTFKITHAQLTALLMHSRNQQNVDGMKNGLTVPDYQLMKQGKTQEAWARAERLMLTPQQLKQLVAQATEYDKAWAAAWQQAQKIAQPRLNQTSMDLNGWYRFQVENYFPIRRDKNYLATDFESLQMDGTIAGMGFTKARKNASNPMMLEDIYTVAQRYINGTSLYVGMAIPVSNFNKVFNAMMPGYEDSPKAALRRVFGSGEYEYIERLLTDIQTGGRKTDSSVMDKLRGKAAGSALGANMSVMIKQAASYPTAAAEIGWKPLMQALTSNRKFDEKLVQKYTSAYWERTSANVQAMNANTQANAIDRTSSLMGAGITGMDKATVRKIWIACEFAVENENKNLQRGTDAYYEEVARKFELAVERTQPEYGVMQRPHILRSNNQLTKAVTMYKTQSMQNFNILYDAVQDYRAQAERYKADQSTENKAELDRSKTKLARAVSSQVVSAVVLAIMTAVGKALLHKPEPYQDDKGELTAGSVSYQLSKDMISSMAGMMVGGSELFDLIVGIGEGKAPYDIEAGSISMVNDLYQAAYKLGNAASAIADSSMSLEQKMQKAQKAGTTFLESVAAIYGIPMKNMENIGTSVYKYVDDIISGRGLEGLTTGDVSLSTGARYMGQALQKGDQETYVRLYNRLLRQGKTQSQINSAMKTWMKQNDPRIQQAANAIDSGDIDTYNRLINEMTADGYGMANVVTAIEAVRKAAASAESGELSVESGVNTPLSYDQIMAAQENDSASAYTYAQLNQLLESGNTQAARKVQSALFKSKGTTAVKSALTSYWKPKYQEAYQQRNRTELNRIVRLLKTMGYSDSSINKWKTAETTTSSSKKKSSSRFGGGFGGSFGSSKKKSSRFGGGFGGGWGG